MVGIGALAAATLAAYPGFKWLRAHRVPELNYLNESRNLIQAVVDTLIPKTDSPSASECGVHDFLIKVVSECTDTPTQNKFIDGLGALNTTAQSQFNKNFTDCSSAERSTVLAVAERRDAPWPGIAGKVQLRYLGSPFFMTLKKYTVIGYCTSEGGATQGLRYSHVPSVYSACEPYHAGEKAWATT